MSHRWYTKTQTPDQLMIDLSNKYSVSSTTPFSINTTTTTTTATTKQLSATLENYFINDNINTNENTAILNKSVSNHRNRVNYHSNYINLLNNFIMEIKQKNLQDILMFLLFFSIFLLTITIIIVILMKILKYYRMNLSFEGQYIFLFSII